MALVAMFLVLISLPLSGLILGFDRTFVLEENRNLATRPELKLDRAMLGAFPGDSRPTSTTSSASGNDSSTGWRLRRCKVWG